MRFAYADPPYFGCGKRHYTQHHDDAAKWDTRDAHLELVATLRGYDGAALSCLARDLAWLLPACPGNALVAHGSSRSAAGSNPTSGSSARGSLLCIGRRARWGLRLYATC